MKNFALLAGLILLVGCSIVNPPKNYTQIMNDWLGAPIEELIKAWGDPAYKFNLSDGRQQYHWDRLAAAVSPDSLDYGPGGREAAKPNLVTSGECGITVTVDPYHKVASYSRAKPGCEKMGLPRSRRTNV